MNNPETSSEIQMDASKLYLEEVFTDNTVGTLRRLSPVTPSGDPDATRSIQFVGATQVLTSAGPLPLSFEIAGESLAEAAANFGWGEESGALQFTVIEKNSFKFLRTFISIARGKPNRYARPDHGYTSHNANSISINMQGSLNLDGEILSANSADGPVQISASPALTFIRL